MMQCRDIDELMVEYLYQELDPAKLAEFETHVQGCARCLAEVGSLQRTRQAMRALPETDPPPALSARLLHEASRRAPSPDGGLFGWIAKLFQPILAHPTWAAAASVALLLVVTTVMSVKGKVSPRIEVEPDTAATAPAPEPAAPGVTTSPAATAATPPPASAPAAATPTPAAEPKPARVVAGKSGYLAAPGGDPASDRPAENEPVDSLALREDAAKQEVARGRSATAEEQKVLRSAKQGARRDEANANALKPPAEEGTGAATVPEAPPAEFRPPAAHAQAPAKPMPKAAKKAAADEDGQRALGGVADDRKLSKEDAVPQGKAETAPEPARQPAAEAPVAQAPAQESAQSQAEPTQPSSDSRSGAPATAAAPAPAPPPPPPPSSTIASGAKEKGQAAGAAANTRAQDEEAERKAPADKDANTDRSPAQAAGPPAAAPSQPVAQSKSAPEAAEQQLLRDAQKQAAGGQCASALTITKKIQKMNPDFYQRHIAGDKTFESCSSQRKSKAANPAPAKAREADQTEDKAAK